MGHEESNNNSIFKIAINLVFACLISGIILGFVYSATAPTAEAAKLTMKENSLKSLVAGADTYQEIEAKPGWYEVSKDGQLMAYIVPAEGTGYAGKIALLVAIDPDMKIMKYTITESKETPGLGDKAKVDPFAGQFAGKDAEHLEVTKDPSNTDLIQSISGSTITARAVTNAVKEALEEVTAFTKGGQ